MTTATNTPAARNISTDLAECYAVELDGRLLGYASRRHDAPTFSLNLANGIDLVAAPTTIIWEQSPLFELVDPDLGEQLSLDVELAAGRGPAAEHRRNAMALAVGVREALSYRVTTPLHRRNVNTSADWLSVAAAARLAASHIDQLYDLALAAYGAAHLAELAELDATNSTTEEPHQ